ncbi:hypothetical protein P0R31_33970 [Bradyrhizobium yuanmingense]|nr:hypothetical protein [Bradyrhizobium yuanmingense]MDF0522250.1 hypothetical protein [Bradyrhizobium yuanmingense]
MNFPSTRRPSLRNGAGSELNDAPPPTNCPLAAFHVAAPDVIGFVDEERHKVLGHPLLDSGRAPADDQHRRDDDVGAQEDVINLRDGLWSMAQDRDGRQPRLATEAAARAHRNSMNLADIWLLRLRFGTTTKRRSSGAAASSASMVHVFPVPVGMTTVVGFSDVLQ